MRYRKWSKGLRRRLEPVHQSEFGKYTPRSLSDLFSGERWVGGSDGGMSGGDSQRLTKDEVAIAYWRRQVENELWALHPIRALSFRDGTSLSIYMLRPLEQVVYLGSKRPVYNAVLSRTVLAQVIPPTAHGWIPRLLGIVGCGQLAPRGTST